MIFVVSAAFCQQSTPAMILFYIKSNKTNTKFSYLYSAIHIIEEKTKFSNEAKTSKYLPPVSILSANYYTNNFGFFCKKEWQFEKITKIPFRFRLGSLQYNDYLEQKPNAIKQF